MFLDPKDYSPKTLFEAKAKGEYATGTTVQL